MSKRNSGETSRAEQLTLLPPRTKGIIPKSDKHPSLTKYAILKRNYMMEHEPSLYLGLLTAGRLYGYLLKAQKDAEALRKHLITELPKIIPMPEEARTSFLARVRFEIMIAQHIHEIIMEEVIYEITD